MALRDRKRQQSSQEQIERRRSQVGFALGPMLATVDGQPVTVIAYIDDIPGHSPAYLCVDDENESDWVSKDDVKLFPAGTPLTVDIFGKLQSRIRQQDR